MLLPGSARLPNGGRSKTIRIFAPLILVLTMACDSPTRGTAELEEPRPRAGRKNLILISLGGVGGDLLDKTLREDEPTLFVDRLVREATQFGQAITPSSSTMASNASLLSGQYPATHGVIGMTSPIPSSLQTLPRFLRRAGYTTAAAVTGNSQRSPGSGFVGGFDAYREITASDALGSGTMAATFDSGIEWIEHNHEKLFFLFLDPDETSPKNPLGGRAVEDDLARSASQPRTPGNDTADLRRIDRGLERLFAQLKSRDLLEDTVVVLTAEHGEALVERGQWRDASSVYDEVLRVPLLFWSAGQVPQGVNRSGVVSLVDILPTVLELLGIHVPTRIAGRSLVAAIYGDPLPGNRTRFAETSGPGLRLIAARTDEYKWIWQATPPALRVYDLRQDPGETTPLYDPELLDRGRVLIEAYHDLRAQR